MVERDSKVLPKIISSGKEQKVANFTSHMIPHILRKENAGLLNVDFLTRALTKSIKNPVDNISLIRTSLYKENEVINKAKMRKFKSILHEPNWLPESMINCGTYKLGQPFNIENKDIRRDRVSLPDTTRWSEL
ncbi:uncharacterized protein DS421_3g70690 [Arachis hypogaea]|nr:uncharacterized protein DS421_3g70690 [Arachis hypogaea]